MSQPLEFTSNSEEDTARLGRSLAEVLRAGSIVALTGNLGAGKTRLVQAIAEAMGVDRRDVRSPTFVLVHEYEGRLPIYHIDAYRLHDSDEFFDLGAEEILDSDGPCLIEWADRVPDALPRDHLRISINITGPSTRLFTLSGSGPSSQAVLEELRQCFDVT